MFLAAAQLGKLHHDSFLEIQAPMTLDQRHTVCRVSLWRFSADG